MHRTPLSVVIRQHTRSLLRKLMKLEREAYMSRITWTEALKATREIHEDIIGFEKDLRENAES